MRPRTVEWLLGGCLVASVVATFLSWGTSGSVGRSSYALVGSARTLDLLDNGVVRLAPVWFAVPFVAAAAVLALAVTRLRLAGGLAAAVGVVLVIGWWIVKSSPVGVDVGAMIGLVVGVTTALLGGAMVLGWTGGRR